MDTIYYGVWGLSFLLVFVVVLIPAMLVLSLLPQMLFSDFYAKVYKKVGFLPEVTITLFCGVAAYIMVTNTFNAVPYCVSPFDGNRYYLYQVGGADAPLYPNSDGTNLLQTVPARSLLYSPLPPTDVTKTFIPVTGIQTPPHSTIASRAISGYVARNGIVKPSYLKFYDSFFQMPCESSIFVDKTQLWAWWLAF